MTRAIGVPVALFDLDSTLADTRNRREHCPTVNPDATWDEFFAACGDDDPVPGPVQLARLVHQLGLAFDIVTWRPDRFRDTTRVWLRRHRIFPRVLRMREDGDGEDSNVFKVAYVAQLRAQGDTPVLLVDDWPQTAAAVQAVGVPTLCVNPRYGDADPVESVPYLTLGVR